MSSSSTVPQLQNTRLQPAAHNKLVEAYRQRAKLAEHYGVGALVYAVFAFALYLKIGQIGHPDDGRILVGAAFIPPLLAGLGYVYASARRIQRVAGGDLTRKQIAEALAVADKAMPPVGNDLAFHKRLPEFRAQTFADEVVKKRR